MIWSNTNSKTVSEREDSDEELEVVIAWSSLKVGLKEIRRTWTFLDCSFGPLWLMGDGVESWIWPVLSAELKDEVDQ